MKRVERDPAGVPQSGIGAPVPPILLNRWISYSHLSHPFPISSLSPVPSKQVKIFETPEIVWRSSPITKVRPMNFPQSTLEHNFVNGRVDRVFGMTKTVMKLRMILQVRPYPGM